ncbi:MAG: lyase family protein, partial [Candidatus Neomarinimicrobiota bacterium]
MKKLWDKGYDLNQQIESFTVGNDPDLDLVLIPYDCRASIAHTKMLGKIGVLDAGEVEQLVYSLERIIALHAKGAFTISREQEDGHTAIETYLTQQLGAMGKKIHTARSRNDQVLTALRLYYKDQIDEIAAGVEALVVNLTEFITRYGAIALPGYTHTRKAMPSSLTMWAGAFVDSMRDNLQLLETTRSLLDQSPLGTAAGYGVPMPIDRAYVADLLGFARVQQNPIYAQLSRGKFESTIL